MRPVKLVWMKGPVFPGDHVMRPFVRGRKGPGRFYNPLGDDFVEEAVPFNDWTMQLLREGSVVVGDSKAAVEKAFADARKASIAADVTGHRAERAKVRLAAVKAKAARKAVDKPAEPEAPKAKEGGK